jgi:hypothetical protein
LRTKATRKPQSLRYLLWVDNKLQRISMKKVALPLGKARKGKAVRAARAKKSARPVTPAPKEFKSAITSRPILMAIIALSGAAILLTMGRARGPETTAADVRLPAEGPLETPAFEPPPAVPEIAPEPVPAKAPTPPSEPRTMAAAVVATPPSAPPAPPPPAPAAVAESTPTEIVAPPTVPPADAEASAATTITGCLMFDDGNYRLKDVAGEAAPKSRSWKSGFLRKRSTTIDVFDAAHSLGMANYVGKRVEATGTLSEREMQVRSLQRVADSCRQ